MQTTESLPSVFTEFHWQRQRFVIIERGRFDLFGSLPGKPFFHELRTDDIKRTGRKQATNHLLLILEFTIAKLRQKTETNI